MIDLLKNRKVQLGAGAVVVAAVVWFAVGGNDTEEATVNTENTEQVTTAPEATAPATIEGAINTEATATDNNVDTTTEDAVNTENAEATNE